MLNGPDGVAVDGLGHLFIADANDNRIREVNLSTGVITTVAGDGTGGYVGDNGAATAAELYDPGGVAADAYGDLFIADTYNDRIREVNLLRASSPPSPETGRRASPATTAPAAASLDRPEGIALDFAGNLYVADQGSQRIRRIAPGALVTVAQAAPTLTVADAGGVVNGSLFPATATVAGVISGWTPRRGNPGRGRADGHLLHRHDCHRQRITDGPHGHRGLYRGGRVRRQRRLQSGPKPAVTFSIAAGTTSISVTEVRRPIQRYRPMRPPPW